MMMTRKMILNTATIVALAATFSVANGFAQAKKIEIVEPQTHHQMVIEAPKDVKHQENPLEAIPEDETDGLDLDKKLSKKEAKCEIAGMILSICTKL